MSIQRKNQIKYALFLFLFMIMGELLGLMILPFWQLHAPNVWLISFFGGLGGAWISIISYKLAYNNG